MDYIAYVSIMDILDQLIWLFVLSIPIACISWTVTHEEVFKEFFHFCKACQKKTKNIAIKKFFYLFTCEYCFSHYITLFFLLLTGYKLLLDDWRGYVISFFALVWVSNVYINLFSSIRTDIKSEKKDIAIKEEKLNNTTKQSSRND